MKLRERIRRAFMTREELDIEDRLRWQDIGDEDTYVDDIPARLYETHHGRRQRPGRANKRVMRP